MRFPKMRSTEQTREFIQEFGGLDRRVRGAENAFAEMRNMSSDFYPALSPRPPRGIVRGDMADCTALTACGKLAYIKGNTLYFGEGNDAVTMKLREDVTEKRQLVTMGAYLVVLPDCMYLNTVNTKDRGVWRVTRTTADFVGATLTMNVPTSSVTGAMVDDTHGVFFTAQMYDAVNGSHLIGVPNPTMPYFADYKVTSEGVTLQYGNDAYAIVSGTVDSSGTVTVTNLVTGISVTHTVKIGAIESDASIPTIGAGYWVKSDGLYYIDDDSGTQTKQQTSVRVACDSFSKHPDGELINFTLCLQGPNGDFPKYAPIKIEGATVEVEDGELIIPNAPLAYTTFFEIGADIKVTCEFNAIAPKMDFVIEAKNRLWGCRHGQDVNGNTVNEIYASALGDFREWYRLNGISTDSWTAAVGHVGDFTGAINYRGYPLFFKENVMYKIYGDYPENFQIISDESMGVQAGCDKSLCVLSGVLYYRSPNGFVAYDGSSSVRIDAVLGRERFTDAVCGGAGSKLYVSMRGENKAHSGLYVYDTEKDLWHMEDDTQVLFFQPYAGDLYFLDGKGRLCTARGSAGGAEAAPIVFAAETGIIGYSTPDSKYVSRLALRVSVPHDGYLNIFIEYNSSGAWEFKGSIEGNGLQSFTVPVVPQVCDHFRIRFAGEGNCRVFGFSKVLEEGGMV